MLTARCSSTSILAALVRRSGTSSSCRRRPQAFAPVAAASAALRSCRHLSSKNKQVATEKKGEEEEGVSVNVAEEKRKEMSKFDSHMVWGKAGEYMPAPVLPDDPSEIALLDPADQAFRKKEDGTDRFVIIRQQKMSMRQAPMNREAVWKIYFNEDGTSAEKWNSSLMGWTANADPYQVGNHLDFHNAAEAVYFAKKRGWKYVVKHPILRIPRDDDAQYQDNFLPQAIADQVQREGATCKEWQRKSSGTSHYFRPLKYHGDGTVPQHGPHPKDETVPHVEGYYKMR